jgi:hypothetical protein
VETTAHVRSIAVSLRALAVFILLNGVSVLLPERWIDAVLVRCGIGHLPDAALFRYFLRGSGVLLVSFGVLIWVVASDVVRYRPIVITLIGIFLVCAPVSYWIGAVVGLPPWWCILDATICVFGGGIPLVFCLLHSKKSPN